MISCTRDTGDYVFVKPNLIPAKQPQTDKEKHISNLKLQSTYKHKYKLNSINSMIEFQANNHVILSDCKQGCLHIIDLTNFNYIKKFDFKDISLMNPSGLCEIPDKNLICFVDHIGKDICIHLLDASYSIVKRNYLSRSKINENHALKRMATIDYCNLNNLLYLVDHSTCSVIILDIELNVRVERYIGILSAPEFIKIVNNRLYICDNSDCSQVVVLDGQLNYITSIGVGKFEKASCVLTDVHNESILYVTDYAKKCLNVFKLNGEKYEHLKKISLNMSPLRGIIYDEKVLIMNDSNEFQFYKISWN